MSNFRRTANRQKLWMVGLIVLTLILTAIIQDKSKMLGLLVGVTISYVNLLILYRKATPLAESEGTEGFSKGFGSFYRLVKSIFGAFIASLYVLIIGLLVNCFIFNLSINVNRFYIV